MCINVQRNVQWNEVSRTRFSVESVNKNGDLILEHSSKFEEITNDNPMDSNVKDKSPTFTFLSSSGKVV